MPRRFVTLDVFTSERFAGNPLAVVLDAEGLDTAGMQRIAKEFNLSETVFVFPASEPRQRADIRIFTPARELPFAGHPTIGTACYALGTLAPKGVAKGRLNIPAGTVEATFANGVAKAAIPHNVHLHSEGAFSADMLEALQPSLRGAGGAVLGIDVMSPVRGMNFVCVELESLEVLASVGCTGSRPAAKLDGEWDVGFVGALFYVKTGEEEGKDGSKVVRVRTRMIEGPLEDPATGSAASDLAAYLSQTAGEASKTFKYEIIQGVEMGRRSEIFIEVEMNEDKSVAQLFLEGSAVQVMEGRLTV